MDEAAVLRIGVLCDHVQDLLPTCPMCEEHHYNLRSAVAERRFHSAGRRSVDIGTMLDEHLKQVSALQVGRSAESIQSAESVPVIGARIGTTRKQHPANGFISVGCDGHCEERVLRIVDGKPVIEV